MDKVYLLQMQNVTIAAYHAPQLATAFKELPTIETAVFYIYRQQEANLDEFKKLWPYMFHPKQTNFLPYGHDDRPFTWTEQCKPETVYWLWLRSNNDQVDCRVSFQLVETILV